MSWDRSTVLPLVERRQIRIDDRCRATVGHADQPNPIVGIVLAATAYYTELPLEISEHVMGPGDMVEYPHSKPCDSDTARAWNDRQY